MDDEMDVRAGVTFDGLNPRPTAPSWLTRRGITLRPPATPRLGPLGLWDRRRGMTRTELVDRLECERYA